MTWTAEDEFQEKLGVPNQNHPKEGSTIRVDPIIDLGKIQEIKDRLLTQGKYRDHALFVVGINTSLRASDLVKLRVGEVENIEPMGEIVVREQKTGKLRRLTLNKAAVDAIRIHLKRIPKEDYSPGSPLFESQRWNGKGDTRLTVPSVNRLVKRWCKLAGLKGNFGSHTLRKTWGYHQRVTFNMALPVIMEAFGHSSEKQTLTYLCIQPEEVKQIYANEL